MQNEAQQQGALQPDPGQTEESLQNHIADESKEYSAPVRPEAPDPVVKADLSEDAASEDNTPEKKPMQPAEPEIVFEKEICFRIDTKKPQKVHFSYNRAILEGSILTNEPVELTLKSTDEGSGMEAICYKTGDGTAGVLTGDSGSIVLNPGFRGQIEAYAVDKAGNQSEPELSAMLLCENQSPEIQIETEGSPDAWRSDPLRVHVKVTDPGLSAGIQCLKCYAGSQCTGKMKPRRELHPWRTDLRWISPQKAEKESRWLLKRWTGPAIFTRTADWSISTRRLR